MISSLRRWWFELRAARPSFPRVAPAGAAPGGPRGTAARERTFAALLFLLLALAFLARGLPPGRVPVCLDPLYAQAGNVPFAAARPPDFAPHNPYLSDQALVFYPWLKFMSEAVRGGELPLWSPHSGGGLPFIGNLSSAFFFPTTWLCFLPPEILTVGRGMLLGALVRLWLAGFFGWLFLRRIGLARAAALCGGAGLMLFGYQVVWLYYSLSNVACLIPLCLYLTQLFAERPAPGRGLLLALALAVQFLGGHAETSLALGLAVSAWFSAAAWRGSCPVSFGAALGRFALVALLALCLSAYQLFPFVEYLLRSEGRRERLIAAFPAFAATPALSLRGALHAVPALALLCAAGLLLRRGLGQPRPWRAGLVAGLLLLPALLLLLRMGLRPHFLLALEPDLYGSPLLPDGYRGPETYTDMNGGYAGAFALGAALLCLIASRRRRIVLPFALLALLAWALLARVEPFCALLRQAPLFDLAAGTRMLPLAGVATAVLAACAIDDIGRGEGRRYALALQRLFACAAVPALAAAAFFVAGRVLPESREWRAAAPQDGIQLLRPLDGEVFRPDTLGRRAGRLVVPFELDLPPGVRRAVVRAGGGAVASALPDTATTERGGRLVGAWDATRQEAGRYSVAVEVERVDGALMAGPLLDIVIDRDPRVTLAGLLRGAGALLLLFLLARRGGARPALLLLAPVAVAAELLLFGFDYNAYVPQKAVYPRTALTDFLEGERARRLALGEGPFRVLGENVILQPNMHYAYGCETPRSYDQLENRRFNVFLRNAVGPNTNFQSYSHRTVDYRNPLFALLNVRFIVSGENLDHVPGLREAAHSGHGRVYENLEAEPRALIVGQALDTRGLAAPELLELVALARTHALLEEEPPAPLGGRGTVRFLHTGLNRVELQAECDGPALLVLLDNAFPGWEARVNGTRARIYTTHGAFRAVPVPAGTSRVEFRYRPASFFGGLALAAAALLIALRAELRAARAARRSPVS